MFVLFYFNYATVSNKSVVYTQTHEVGHFLCYFMHSVEIVCGNKCWKNI